MFYLIGTQVIVDIARGSEGPPARWLRSIDGRISARDIKVSSMSWASIQIEFKKMSRERGSLTPTQSMLQQRIDRVFSRYRAMDAVLPMTDAAIQIWVHYLQDDLQYMGPAGMMLPIGFEEKMVIATAIAGFQDVPISMVTRREVAHDHLRVVGLTIEDPYHERMAP